MNKIYAIIFALNSISTLYLGLYVYEKRRTLKNYLFFNLSICFYSVFQIFWTICTIYDIVLWSAKLLMLGLSFLPYTFLNFCYEITEKKQPRLIRIYNTVGLIGFVFLSFTKLLIVDIAPILDFPYWPIAGILFPVYFLYFSINVSLGLYLLCRMNQKNMWPLIIGALFGFGGGSTNFILFYRIPISPLGNFLISIYAPLTAFAVARFGMFNIRQALSTSKSYLVLFFLVAISFLSIIFVIQIDFGWKVLIITFAILWMLIGYRILASLTKQQYLSKASDLYKYAVSATTAYFIMAIFVAISFLIILLMIPIDFIWKVLIITFGILWALIGHNVLTSIQKPINRVVLKETYNIDELIKKITNSFIVDLDLETTLKKLLKFVEEVIPYKQAYVFILVADQYVFKPQDDCIKADLTVCKDDPLPTYFCQNQEVIGYKELPEAVTLLLPKMLCQDKNIFFPLYALNNLYGLIIFESVYRHSFTKHDFVFLSALKDILRFVLNRVETHERLKSKNVQLETKVEETQVAHKKALTELEKTKKIEQELHMARNIQRRLLPEHAPTCMNYRFDTTFKPARIVSGDYYQFFPFSDTEIGIVIADVVGKGIVASYMMFVIHALLTRHINRRYSPKEMVTHLNTLFIKERAIDKYMPMVYAVLNTKTNELTYCNAGHEPPLLITDKSIKALTEGGMPVGMDESNTYEEEHITLNDRDSVLFFTDGLTDARDKNGQTYGIERIEAICNSYMKDITREESLITKLIADWSQFEKDVETQKDDMTLIFLECRLMRYYK